MSLPTSGRILWYKADAGVFSDAGGLATPAVDGNNVGRWADQSGNGNDTTPTPNKPIYRTAPAPTAGTSGLPLLDFGAAGGLPTPLTVTTPFTVLAVYTGTADGQAHRALDGNIGHNWLIGPYANFNACYMGGFVSQNTSPGLVTGTLYRTAATNSGSASTFAVDGVDYTTGGANVTTPGQVALGAAGGQGQGLLGFFAELVIYSRVLNSTELADANTYLARWTTAAPAASLSRRTLYRRAGSRGSY